MHGAQRRISPDHHVWYVESAINFFQKVFLPFSKAQVEAEVDVESPERGLVERFTAQGEAEVLEKESERGAQQEVEVFAKRQTDGGREAGSKACAEGGFVAGGEPKQLRAGAE